MRTRKCKPIGFLLPLGLLGCSFSPAPPLETVPDVDLQQYVGLWYEIARYPTPFQDQCFGGVTAEYTLRDDGQITVINTCRKGSLDGPVDRIEGVARVVNEETNAELKVRFFLFFEGDYFIIDLDEDYEWAVVGEPSRRLLWILSRTQTMAPAVYEGILYRLPDKGYDPAGLVLTPQPPGP